MTTVSMFGGRDEVSARCEMVVDGGMD